MDTNSRPADPIDLAVEQQEKILELQLKKRREPGLTFTGHCRNCNDPIADPLRFCDGDCEEDFFKRVRLRG